MDQQNLPPTTDPDKARAYLDKLISLINQRKFPLTHSDLNKFDACGMVDHYRIDLGNYFAEISHSKHPNSGKDVFALVFTNIEKIRQGNQQEAILSYLPLTPDSFEHFKTAAEHHFELLRKEAEEKRFQAAMRPIDELLAHPTPPETSQTSDTTYSVGNPDNRSDSFFANFSTSQPLQAPVN